VEQVFVNGHILTMEDAFPEIEAMAVGGGRIVSIGSTEEISSLHPQAEVVDLQGKTVMPGIIESHGHLLSLGQSLLELNIEGVSTPEEAVRKVEERLQTEDPGEWILAWGWDDGAWAKDYPDNRELSRISPDNPVYLKSLHGFAGWANARALELAGITASTPDPPHGKILKDADTGEPTGILTNEAQGLLTRIIPPLNPAQVERALELATLECLKYGLTGLHEARTTRVMLEALRAMKAKGSLHSRIYVMLDWTEEDLLEEYFHSGPDIDPDFLLTVRCLKIFVDGALGSRGAALLEPYSDAFQETGLVVTPEDQVYELTRRSLNNRLQVAVHAIGDRATRITLDAFAQAIQDVPGVKDHRLRVEHAQIVAPEDILRFAPLNLVLSMQPPHCTSDMPWVEERVGPARVKGAYAWRSILDTGVHMTLNSDFPGETLNPFVGMYAAMTRQSADGLPEGGWYPEQCLTRSEVLKAYTTEAAYSEFTEGLKGKILPGMLADFIVLSDDILTIPVEGFLTLQVEQTYLGGALVFQRHLAGEGMTPEE
jgi:predicted amidohydrolase YtcJ